MLSEREIRQRAPLWLIASLLVNFALMTFDARDPVTKQRVVRVWLQAAAAPVERLLSALFGTGSDAIGYLAELRRAARENQELRARVAAAEAELHELRTARDENERLKGLLELKEQKQYKIVPARVIARDPSAWFDTVIINRGRSSGVELQMPVVTSEGIVGRVVATSPWTAQVMLITDERSGVGAVVGQLSSSGAIGVVRGSDEHNGLLKMLYVSGLETVNVGDRVITTGQDSIYPPGWSIGTVIEVKPGAATTTHEIVIRPSARLDSLEEVAVLLYRPDKPEMDRALPNVERRR
ncbi:MAG: rod shape-determining protein MreC [Pyrinomonas sp.]|uniref:rod shape-determining protein MreC n=1 Tax=Pyrinomonas sp. TaxID=2080306 RepID=UPI00332BD4ED